MPRWMYAKGWPRRLPCLTCDRPRQARNPGDRVCAKCKRDKWTAVEHSELRDPSPGALGDNVGTRIDTTVVVMDANGQVLERVAAATFAARGDGNITCPGRPPQLRKKGHPISDFLTPRVPTVKAPRPRPASVEPRNKRHLGDLTAEMTATWTTWQREHYRDRFRKAGLPVPAFLAPRKSGPKRETNVA
jgi:hypothetical protein